MINFILQIQSNTASVPIIKNSSTILTSFWFWLAIVEFVLILLLLIRIKSKKTNLAFSDAGKDNVKNAKEKNINMDNLMDSINGSRELYKELSRKCHPDKFINSPKQKIAEDLFQEISNNQRNFEKLSELKVRATNELNINF